MRGGFVEAGRNTAEEGLNGMVYAESAGFGGDVAP